MSRHRMTLTMLSPVHIGTGEELTPDEYIIRRGKDGCMLHALDLPALLGHLSATQRAEFDQAVRDNSLASIRRFIDGHADPARHARWSAPAQEDLAGLYEQMHAGRNVELAIHPMTRTGLSCRSYIPGSSVKGAIRTAVLQHIYDSEPSLARAAESEARQRHRNADCMTEAVLLGNLNEKKRPDLRADPFRAVRVSDAGLPDNATGIDPVELFSLKPDRPATDPSGILMFYEMTYCALDDQIIEARGTLAVDERIGRTRGPGHRWDFEYCVSRPLEAATILRACRAFYQPRLEAEAQRLSRAVPDAAPVCRELLARSQRLADNETLIRLGRFSHIECITLAPPLRAKPDGTSRCLAGGLPMGWCILRLD